MTGGWLPDPPPSPGPVTLEKLVESLYSDDPDERAREEAYDRVRADLIVTGRAQIGDAVVVMEWPAPEKKP